jgi:hypothetical protein
MEKYRQINTNILEKEILIEIRKRHVNRISCELIQKNILPNNYLDNLIKLEFIKKGIPDTQINNNIRIKYLQKILQIECCKGTAKWINEI